MSFLEEFLTSSISMARRHMSSAFLASPVVEATFLAQNCNAAESNISATSLLFFFEAYKNHEQIIIIPYTEVVLKLFKARRTQKDLKKSQRIQDIRKDPYLKIRATNLLHFRESRFAQYF